MELGIKVIKAVPRIVLNKVLSGDEIVKEILDESIFDNKESKEEDPEVEFRDSLKNFISEYYKQLQEDNPNNLKMRVVVLVDELDRCRPDYALKVLERIKHFFNIPDYIFVFFSNKKEIEKSIEHIYGTANGGVYLEKFYNFQFRLPAPEKKLYIRFLCNEMEKKFSDDIFKSLNCQIKCTTLE